MKGILSEGIFRIIFPQLEIQKIFFQSIKRYKIVKQRGN